MYIYMCVCVCVCACVCVCVCVYIYIYIERESCMSCPYIWEINPLSVDGLWIFSLWVAFSFLFMVSFAMQSL